MLKRVGTHLRGNLVAYIACFLALGGTAVAAKKIGTAQLRNNAVKTSKIANNAITTPKVKNGAVTEGKLANGAAVAKAYGHVIGNGNDLNPPTLDGAKSRGIVSIGQTIANTPGVVCIDAAKPFSVAVATGEDAAGAASPFAFASINYAPGSGVDPCPAGYDLRVTTFDKDNAPPIESSFAIVLF